MFCIICPTVPPAVVLEKATGLSFKNKLIEFWLPHVIFPSLIPGVGLVAGNVEELE